MIVINRKTNIQYELNSEQWAKLVEMKLNRLYRIIDNSEMVKSIQRTNIPKVITEFREDLRINTEKPKLFTERLSEEKIKQTKK